MKTLFTTISKFRALSMMVLLAILTFSCQPNTSVSATDPTAVQPNVTAIMAPFAPKTQTFTVSSKKPSVVTGKAGTKIHVQPKNLTLPDGSPVTGDIQVNLIECTSKSDLLQAGLQTVADGKLLESGGSYYIDMQADGQALKIRDGKTVEVEFPQVTEKDMELFYGSRNEAGQMNWEAAGVDFEVPPAAETVKIVIASDSSTFTIVSDTLYGYVDGKDTIRSSNQEDIWAYINKKRGNSPGENDNKKQNDREEKNRQAMAERRARTEREQAAKKSQQATLRQNQEQSRQARATAATTPVIGFGKPTYAGVNLDRFGWYNCDRFMQEENTQQFAVQLPTTKEGGIVYLVVKALNSIVQLPYAAGEHPLVSSDMPVGQAIEVLVVEGDDKDGAMGFARGGAQVGKESSIALEPERMETGKIKQEFGRI